MNYKQAEEFAQQLEKLKEKRDSEVKKLITNEANAEICIYGIRHEEVQEAEMIETQSKKEERERKNKAATRAYYNLTRLENEQVILTDYKSKNYYGVIGINAWAIKCFSAKKEQIQFKVESYEDYEMRIEYEECEKNNTIKIIHLTNEQLKEIYQFNE